MPTFRLTVAYDGTGLVGWQRQASGVSVQGLLEDAFGALAGAPVAVHGSGRTDAGVHAAGQVASATLETRLPADVIRRALNARLPPAVRVLDVAQAPDDFHARFSARRKTYRYVIWNAPFAGPFAYRYAWHVAGPLDLTAMQEAAGDLIGRHDFTGLQSTGSDVHTAVRTVSAAAIVEKQGPAAAAIVPIVGLDGGRLLVFEITADGFLRHMVRAAAGLIVEIGAGRRAPDSVARVLAARDRALAGPTAPAHGLWLMHVEY